MIDFETSYVVPKKVPCFGHVFHVFHRVVMELNVGEAWVPSQITKEELAFVSAFGAKDDDVFGVYWGLKRVEVVLDVVFCCRRSGS